MRVSNKFIVFAVCLASFGVNAFADIVNPTGGATFRNLNSSSINNNGTPFFDNTSGDGNQCGIGYLLTGANLANCSNKNGNLNSLEKGNDVYSYLSRNNGLTNAGNFSFTSTGNPAHTLTLHIELAGWASSSSFGYRNLTTNSSAVELFSQNTNNPVSATLNVTSGHQFAFFYRVGGTTWWTNGEGSGSSRFALFALNSATSGFSTSSYVLGMEDSRDTDFQDMIVSIRSARVAPEPATVTALSAAVLATILAARRRNRKA